MPSMIWNGRFLCLLLGGIIVLSQDIFGAIEFPIFKTGIIPKPQSIELHKGAQVIHSNLRINSSEDLTDSKYELLQFFRSHLNQTQNQSDKENPTVILLKLFHEKDFGLEGYELSIDHHQIQIYAQDKIGIARGIASLKQLILLNKFKEKYYVPNLTIRDWSRFEHRGMLLDCSRHFFSVEVVKKYIDLLALFKMNTFHWHLTEDQGWRIAIDQYPELAKIGAYRKESDGTSYGGFYSKKEIKDVVAYAAKKQIEIIPEIELPGHSQAAIAAYPHLSCTGKSIEVANDWGVFKDIYCAGNDSVFIFLEGVLTEVMELFPSNKIHIGGDEAPKVRWEECDKCQQRIADHQLKDEHELQSYFIKRIQKFLNKNGRQLIGWDEILEGGLAEGAIVQSWRGMDGGIEAAKHGHQAIMSPTSHAYFDYSLKSIDLEKVYAFDPVPKGLNASERKLIIGGECNMWTEHVPDEKTLDSRVFPRILAMSEVLWSDTMARDYHEFNERVQHFYPLLDGYHVSYGEEALPMTHQMVLTSDAAFIELIPYSEKISLQYQMNCTSCDTLFLDYKEPVKIEETGFLTVQSYKNGKKYGSAIEIPLVHHKAINSEVSYTHLYSNWYTAGGEKGLVDGKKGTLDFRDGSWQGFWGDDLECIIDLNHTVSTVSVHFYQYNNSWIFIPEEMSVEVSNDKKSWHSLGVTKSDINPKRRGKFIHTLSVAGDGKETYAYLKLKVKNIGKVPDWHEAAGSDAWIFIDEIVVE